MKLRSRKSSANDLTVYNPYMRLGIIKYGRDGWVTSEIKRKTIKGTDILISITIKPSMI